MIPPDHHLNQVSRATIVKYLSIQWFVRSIGIVL